MKPVCPHCRLFLVDREGQTCEPCRMRLGRQLNRRRVLAHWARRRAEKAKESTP